MGKQQFPSADQREHTHYTDNHKNTPNNQSEWAFESVQMFLKRLH